MAWLYIGIKCNWDWTSVLTSDDMLMNVRKQQWNMSVRSTVVAFTRSVDDSVIVPSFWRSGMVSGYLLLQDERPYSVALACFSYISQADQGEVKSFLKSFFAYFEKQVFSQSVCKGWSYCGRYVSDGNVLLSTVSLAETSSWESHNADLLAGIENNSINQAPAQAEVNICCHVKIVMTIKRLSKLCLKLKDRKIIALFLAWDSQHGRIRQCAQGECVGEGGVHRHCRYFLYFPLFVIALQQYAFDEFSLKIASVAVKGMSRCNQMNREKKTC